MKKLIALFVAAAMVLSLAGCVSTDNGSKGKPAESSAEASKAEISKAEESKAESKAEESKAEESKAESKAEESKAEESKAEESKAAEASKAEESSKTEESSKAAESSKNDSAAGTLTAGTYYLVGMLENNEMMGTDVLQKMGAFGLSSELTLNEDGTGTFTLFGEVTDLTWDDKTITVDEEPADYVFEDDFLKIFAGDESTQLILSAMNPDELVAAGKAIVGTGQYAPVEGPTLEGDGDVYHLVAMHSEEQVVGTDQVAMLDTLGMSSSLQLNSDGTGTFILYGEATEITWKENTIILDGSEITFEQTEDTLILREDEAYLLFSLKTAQELENAGEGIASTDNTVPEDPAVFTVAGADWLDDPDEEGKKVLAVWLDIENPGTEGFTPDFDAEVTLTQDEAEIEDDWFYFDDKELDDASDDTMREILSGGKNRVVYFFEADPEGGVIHLEIIDWLEETVYVDADMDPKNLPGAPAEPLVIEKVTEYPELEGAATVGTFNSYYEVEILETGFEEPEDEFEEKTFKVVLEFRNNSKETANFWSEIEYTASQDRLGLDTENEENAFEDVEAGGKITVTLEWELISDSPIALVITDFMDDAVIGGVYPVE